MISSVVYRCVYFRPRENCMREEMCRRICVYMCSYLCLLPALMFLSSLCASKNVPQKPRALVYMLNICYILNQNMIHHCRSSSQIAWFFSSVMMSFFFAFIYMFPLWLLIILDLLVLVTTTLHLNVNTFYEHHHWYWNS